MDERDDLKLRQRLDGLAAADRYELEELRRTPVELKLQQLCALMQSARVFDDHSEREAGVRQVRERWLQLRERLHA